MKKREVARRLAIGTALALVIAQGAALAQTVPASVQEQPTQAVQNDPSSLATAQDAASAEAQPNDVVVTGSRIARPEFEAPNPITSFNAANIEQSGNTNVTNFLLRTPALQGSLDSTQTAGYDSLARSPFGGAGVNELNLRNLGTNRTLTLVNGRRHVSGEAGTAAVDIQSIPTDLIERVDVLTGGASAVYGADGVSGVVNFILKRDFDGVSARLQSGLTQYGDAPNRFASVIAGKNFAQGRGNITLAYEYDYDGELALEDRKQFQAPGRLYLLPNPDNPTGAADKPINVLLSDVRYAGESAYGAIYFPGDPYPRYRGDGQVYNNGQLDSYYALGGDSTPAAPYTGDLLPRIQRHSANLLTHFDFSDAFKLSLEGKFVQVSAQSLDVYSGNYPATIFLDNPFIPANILADAKAFRDADGNPTDRIYSTRDDFDFGRRGESDRRRTWRGVVDATGKISDHATYDASFVYGQVDVNVTRLRDRYNDRFTASLDAVTDPGTGRPTCRSNIDPVAAAALNAFSFTPGPSSGCVPINTFGEYVADPAALAFFQVNDTSKVRVTQTVANASISGDFGALFALPGGPIQFAFGGEYRRETSRFTPNALLGANYISPGDPAGTAPYRGAFYQYDEPSYVQGISGKFDVKEAFGELNLPVLKDKRFAETLSIGTAGRFSHYSTAGNTTTWQFNGIYAPVRDISFRGSYGKAVRAPNVGELFTPSAFARGFVNDPCDISQLNAGTQYRTANCAALLTPLGVDPTKYNPLNPNGGGADGDGTAFGTYQGNAALKTETARTWTAGIVLRPRFIPGLTMSADWYHITLRGAISTPDAQTIVNLCVDQPTIQNVYCDAISRKQGTGKVIAFTVQPQNVSRFETAGLDWNIDYLLHTHRVGTFDLRLVGGYLNKLDIVATPGADVDNQVNLIYRPRWNAAFTPTWTIGGLTVAYTLRWVDSVLRFPRFVTDGQPNAAAPNLLHISDAWLSDLQAAIAVNKRFSFYGGVTNLTDQKPDPDTYDIPAPSIGRAFYIGVKMGLGHQGR